MEARQGQFAAALDELCRLYWFPLYAFARRRGLGPEDAEDVTQDFFAELLANPERLLRRVDENHWRLRTFFLTVFRRRLVDWDRHRRRLKRDVGRSEQRGAPEVLWNRLPSEGTPEEAFSRQWARMVLEHAASRLRRDLEAVGRDDHFQVLSPFLGLETEEQELDYGRVEQVLGLTSAGGRKAVSRFRARFREALRSEIADTLYQPTEELIDDELRELQAILRGTGASPT